MVCGQYSNRALTHNWQEAGLQLHYKGHSPICENEVCFFALLPEFSVLSCLARLHPKSKHFVFLFHWCDEIFSVMLKKTTGTKPGSYNYHRTPKKPHKQPRRKAIFAAPVGPLKLDRVVSRLLLTAPGGSGAGGWPCCKPDAKRKWLQIFFVSIHLSLLSSLAWLRPEAMKTEYRNLKPFEHCMHSPFQEEWPLVNPSSYNLFLSNV